VRCQRAESTEAQGSVSPLAGGTEGSDVEVGRMIHRTVWALSNAGAIALAGDAAMLCLLGGEVAR
jgi:hypothetical protein